MRKEPLVTDEFYHVYNRGVDKRDILNDTHDLERFKESIKQFNHVDGIGSLELHHKHMRGLDPSQLPTSDPIVAIIAFCINPNHFHFVLKQLKENGIAKFLQKLQGGYTYYFNHKNDRSGSLFQGTFKSKRIDSEDYLRKIFAYTNLNYLVHNIPKKKLHLVFASNEEYENNVFDFVSRDEGHEVTKMFGGINRLRKHCLEIVSIIREERGRTSLTKDEELPQ